MAKTEPMDPIQNRVANEAKTRTDSDRSNNWLVTNYVVEVRNAFANYENIRQLRQAGRAYPMDDFKRKGKGRAMVVGSGSSLDLYVERLKDWPGKIFCSTSQGSTLVYHGRHPDHLCLVDPNSAPPESPEYDVPNNDWGNSILTTHPSGPWRDIKRWKETTPNDVYFFRLHDTRLEWYRSTLYYAYPWIESIIIPFLDSTAAQIAVAAYLGYDPIYLLGVDYGGPRFRKSIYQDGEWVVDPESRYDGGSLNYYDAITPEGVGTAPAYLFTKRGPCMCIAMHLYHGMSQRVYTLAPHDRTLMVELPYADFDKIVETGEDPPDAEYNTQKVYDDLSIYLAWTNTYAAPIHNGLGKSLAKYAVKDISDLPAILSRMNQDLARSKAYYQNMIKKSGMSLKEIAESGAVPDEGQKRAMMHIDLDAMRGVNIPEFMERAAAMHAIGNQRYGQRIRIRKEPVRASTVPKKEFLDRAEGEYLDVMTTPPKVMKERLAQDKDNKGGMKGKMHTENEGAYYESMGKAPGGLGLAHGKEVKHLRAKRKQVEGEYLEQMDTPPTYPENKRDKVVISKLTGDQENAYLDEMKPPPTKGKKAPPTKSKGKKKAPPKRGQ